MNHQSCLLKIVSDKPTYTLRLCVFAWKCCSQRRRAAKSV